MILSLAQDDYNVVKQRIINKYIRLNLLDFNYNVVDEISGYLVDFNISCNADSDLRRSCSVSMINTNGMFDVASGSRIFLNRYIQPYIGYENIRTGEIQWYNQGIYLINSPSYQYDAVNNSISFDALDLMSKLTGLRYGQLEGIPTVISQGESVRDAIISTLALGGFTQYVVDECRLRDGGVQAVPYDIEIDQGGTLYDILSKLRDILPQYQIYFDVDGVFHYEQIPSGEDDPVLIDDDLISKIIISESINTDFESVKNYVEVYGKTHDIDNYASEITVSGAVISLTISSLTQLAEYNMIGFTTPANAIEGNIQLNVNSTGAKNLVDGSGNYITHLDANTYYVAYYTANDTWEFMGHLQAKAIYSDTNPDSPFYVDGPVGKIRYVCCGGDYDNITSDELALERAKLEIYWRCRLQDNISINCVPIPWMDVNIIMSHAPKGGLEENRYMIKSFSANYGASASMSITGITYYPYYPIV